jgi:hypothetical protein
MRPTSYRACASPKPNPDRSTTTSQIARVIGLVARQVFLQYHDAPVDLFDQPRVASQPMQWKAIP